MKLRSGTIEIREPIQFYENVTGIQESREIETDSDVQMVK
jgi:hypothetical protein